MAATDTPSPTLFRAQPDEYEALTSWCGLVDRSARGKLALTGGERRAFLTGQVTNDVEGLTAGTGCYAAVLTPKGKMLGDVRILETGDELQLDCERVALQPLFDMLRRALIGFDAELHKRTLQRGLLSLVGPRAREVAGAPDLPADEHTSRRTQIGGHETLIVATDVGVDVLSDADSAADVVAALRAAGAADVDEGAAEVVRVERGRPRYGIDLDDTTIPQEAGLNERAVSFTKGCYVGQETVARLHYKGKPNRHLRGLRLSAELPAGTPLRLEGRDVGALGSVAASPALGPIALALVRREASVGDVLAAGDGGVSAEVVALPFAR
jgi:folate-binding protein YgfZ